VIHDFFGDEDLSVLHAIRLLGEFRSILAIELVTDSHIRRGGEILEEFSAFLPVSSPL
jgi:hypothetical protein